MINNVTDRLIDFFPEHDRRAFLLFWAGILGGRKTLDRRERSLRQTQNVADHIFIQRLRQTVAALKSPAAGKIARLVQNGNDLLCIFDGNLLSRCHLLDRHRMLRAVDRQIVQYVDRIASLCRNFHAIAPLSSC